MKRLMIPLITAKLDASFEQISQQLRSIPGELIDQVPWPQFAYQPHVQFTIAYSNQAIFLKYIVNENFVRAVYSQPNEPVYKDSCVEFFISFDGQEEYYNLEFNAAGTCLCGFGPDRNGRRMVSEELIRAIRHQAVLKAATKSNASICWELTLAIPLSAFQFHQFTSLTGMKCRLNFYKCGDDLPEPHFLSWNNIDAPEPDFHLRQFFGAAEFT